jgi:hypothetical protein
MSMDRTFVPKNKKLCVYELELDLFREVVFESEILLDYKIAY